LRLPPSSYCCIPLQQNLLSATSKYLLLVKVITNNTDTNRKAGKLQADPEKCAGKGSITAQMMWMVEFMRLLLVV
jgi:hypothetical protein